MEGVSLWGELTCSTGDSGGWWGEVGGVEWVFTGENLGSVGVGDGSC